MTVDCIPAIGLNTASLKAQSRKLFRSQWVYVAHADELTAKYPNNMGGVIVIFYDPENPKILPELKKRGFINDVQ